MRIRRTYRTLFAVLGLVLASCGAREMKENTGAEENKDMAAAMTDSISSVVPMENKAEVELFQNSVRQKFSDLCDYMSIITNKSFDKDLRTQAVEQALDLFDPLDSITVYAGREMGVRAYFDSLLNSDVDSTRLALQVSGLAPFSQGRGEGTYSGTLYYTGDIEEFRKGEKSTVQYLGMKVDLSIRPSSDGKNKGWKIYLGSIHNDVKKIGP